MARRVKEDEKNEKIIRGLLKLPANRRCINCNSPGNTEDSYDKRKVDSFRDNGSPPFDDIDGRHYGEQPGSASLANDHKRSLGCFDIIDEKGRDNKPGYRGQDQKVVDQQFPDGPKIEERLPSHQPLSNSPKIKPVGVINIIPPAPIGQPKKSTGFQFPHSSAQSTASLTSRGSNFGISAEPKLVNSGNLIDFDADPIVPVARALDQYVPQQTASSPAESGGWASFDDSSALKVTQVASAVSTPASLLSQLSVPQTASAANAPSIPIARVGSSPTQSNAGHWPTMHQHQPFVFLGPSVQTMNKPLHETTAGVSTQPPATEAKPTGRKELPAVIISFQHHVIVSKLEHVEFLMKIKLNFRIYLPGYIHQHQLHFLVTKHLNILWVMACVIQLKLYVLALLIF
ncbi:hypothetical protein BHE74_00008219 [Ensete ventricosum]|nr:hypothetical protein BHE74_00008219 [Ensete ventricosum]